MGGILVRVINKITVGIAAGVVLFAASFSDVSAQPNTQSQVFKRRSQILLDNKDAVSTDGSTHRSRLDRKKLTKATSADDAVFLQELTDFSNNVVEVSKTGQDISIAGKQLDQYPRVRDYFQQATTALNEGETLSLKSRKVQNPLTHFALIGSPVTEALGMADCGIYWSPKPGIAKSWVTMRGFRDAQATLRSWGYHDSHIPGAGWTRPQTWHAWNCGWNTFRDNAVPVNSSTINEQNYNGWNPRGEPNPEVYISGPWPYSTWPAYVFWWHQTH
jgi:hypothetical protein